AAEEWADAIMASMKLGGIDHFFFVSGTELAFYQEAVLRARHRGWPTPELITVTHEGAALNAAIGNTMVRCQPAATAAHVDVGTLNYGAGIHTAWRGGYPVLMTAGTGPRAYPGSMPGARDAGVQWVQETRDQGEIVRQYTKMDHRLEHQDNPGMMVSRLLQVAMSEPTGPVYLAVPQETAKLKMPGSTRFPTRDELGVARPVWPDPADAKKIAEWIVNAENPAIYTAQSGRNPDTVAPLVRLAELLALPVMDTTRVNRLNFPTSHPLYGTGPAPKDADVLIILEAPVPFIPPAEQPKPDAKIVWVDSDAVQSRLKTVEYSADMWIPSDVGAFANAVYEAATQLLTNSVQGKIADRRKRLEERKQTLIQNSLAQIPEDAKRERIHPRWVAYQLGEILEPDTILLDDSVSAAGFVRAFHKRDNPGTYFKSGGSSGGWGTGASLGAKLGKPDQDVVLVSGDGYFMFGSPLAALWSASHHKAPFLSVVFVNSSYSTGTSGLARQYPEGEAVTAKDFLGGTFEPPPDFGKLAEAANCYGETVDDPAEVGPALKRAKEQIRNGVPAVLGMKMPTIPEQLGLR
ncbi:MAG: thiamine pyrophosphate-requiring protein, partial [Dehalococcoidia bacterium]